MTSISRDLRVNEAVRSKRVRLIDADGTQVGIVTLKEALEAAQQKDLDLVEVAPQADPPVCRIMDYGKFKYEQAKREREARKKTRLIEVKELKMRPNIEEHDFNVKVRNAEKFLKNGNKVKATIMFRGREIVHSNLGRGVLERLAESVKDCGEVEKFPNMEGRNMVMILTPKGL